MQQIDIEIDDQGNVQVEASGFKGAECKQLTEDIEQALGTVEKMTKKPEYRESRSMGRKVSA